MLKIAIYDGDFFGRMEELTLICVIEGGVEVHDRPSFDTLEETLRVLEICEDRYAVPQLIGPCFTVFVGRMSDAVVTPLARLDGYAHNGEATATVMSETPNWTTDPVRYDPNDDAVEIVRKILAGQRAA